MDHVVTAAHLQMVSGAVAAFGGLSVAAFLAGISTNKRGLLVMIGSASLCGLAIGMTQPWMQLSMTWIAAAAALNASLSIAHGAMERRLLWAVGPVLLLAAVAAHSALSSAQSTLVLTALVATSIASAAAGWWLRHLRQRAWFGEVSVLVLLIAVALMAAPGLLLGWRRAGVAAEGQEAVAPTMPPLWPLAVCASAFVLGVAWRMWMSNRGKR